MKVEGRLLILGSGASMGIPVIGCHCPVCQSDSPCDKRLRPSVLLTIGGKNLLIDCGPDFRTQALKYQIDSLDGVLFTHAHHDHIAGIDELRAFYMRSKTVLPCLLSAETAADIRHRYHYIFANTPLQLTSKIAFQELEGSRGHTIFEGVHVDYVTYEQAKMKVNGFRIGNMAYITDIKHYPDTLVNDLKGIDILILSALRFDPSHFHLGIKEAIAFANEVGAKHTWITHIAHDLEHEATNEYLPPNVRMAYDGLNFSFICDKEK